MSSMFCRRCLLPVYSMKGIQPRTVPVGHHSSISWPNPNLKRFSKLLLKPSLTNDVIHVSEEVSQALHQCKPVVALESTIITHGMPYPVNLQTAQEVEAIVRKNGCTPATIGVINGLVYVGLEKSQMETLGLATKDLVKISRRDFPYVLAKKLSGGTTVSGTMLISHQVGIPIFVTGGIGGVHRGAEYTMDISADLNELGRTPVSVISAGIKSILDIEKTLEYLETQGVFVATFGKDKDFPAFFAPSSGLKAPYNILNEIEAAEIIYASHEKLKLDSGILIGVPLPDEFATSGEDIEQAIKHAVREAREKKIVGKDVTPYILKRVNELTDGESLQANIALIKNNAEVGSKIAWQLNQIIQNSSRQKSGDSPFIRKNKSKTNKKRPIVIGGSVVDFNARLKHTDLQYNGTTNPGKIQQSFGGVGRNIADCLSRLGVEPLFISAIGEDCHTSTFQSYCHHMDLTGVSILPYQSTATYCAVLGKCGQLKLGIGDMDIHQQITPQMICEYEDDFRESAIVVLDGNISPVAIETACDICSNYNIPVLYEPTDINKASKPFDTSAYKKLTYTSPNIGELEIMSSVLTGSPIVSQDLYCTDGKSVDDIISFCLPHCLRLVNTIPVVMITLGKHGVLVCNKQQSNNMQVLHYPAVNVRDEELVSVSGAGDCFVSGFVNGIIKGHEFDVCVKAGLYAASLSLLSTETVPKSVVAKDFQLSSLASSSFPQPTVINI